MKKKLAATEAQARDFGKEVKFLLILMLADAVLMLILGTAETLKKQAKQQAAEYDRLATELNKATGQVSNKKSD